MMRGMDSRWSARTCGRGQKPEGSDSVQISAAGDPPLLRAYSFTKYGPGKVASHNAFGLPKTWSGRSIWPTRSLTRRTVANAASRRLSCSVRCSQSSINSSPSICFKSQTSRSSAIRSHARANVSSARLSSGRDTLADKDWRKAPRLIQSANPPRKVGLVAPGELQRFIGDIEGENLFLSSQGGHWRWSSSLRAEDRISWPEIPSRFFEHNAELRCKRGGLRRSKLPQLLRKP